MNAESVVRNLRTLWRADSLVAEVRLRQVLAQLGLRAFAASVALFGLAMLGLAAWFAIERVWGPVWASAAVAAASFALAGAFLGAAALRQPGRELELALEVHGLAVEALKADARSAQAEFAAATQFLRHPLDAILPGALAPLAGALLRSLRKSQAERAP